MTRSEWKDLCRRLADALENVLSSEPDMPTYADDYHEAERVLDEARGSLE